MSQVSIAPQGFWLKSHFYREGHLLHVVTYSCIAGDPEIFRFSVDLRPIIAAVVKGHNQLHQTKVSGEDVSDALIGFSFSIPNPLKAISSAASGAVKAVKNPVRAVSSVANSAAKIVSKVGKAKLVSQVGAAVKSAVKSKVTGAILAGAAIAFPPVGAPAVAAYAAANAALASIDLAKGAMATAKKVVDTATDPKTRAMLKGELTKWAGATLQKAVADKIPIPKGLGPLAQAMKITKDKAAQAKKLLGQTAAAAKAGNVEAQKLARVVTLAKNARDQLSAVKNSAGRAKVKGKAPVSSQLNGFPAVLVRSDGRIIPGRYIERAGAPKAVALRGRQVLRGSFAAVSGDDIFGAESFGSIGCANPFMKPAHLR